MIQIAAAHNLRQLFADELVVVGDETAASHHMQSEFNRCLRLLAQS